MVKASYGHYAQRAARIGPDHICRIRLPASNSVPFFQRRPGPYCAKPTRIRSGWPVPVLAESIWSRSKLVRKNHLAWFLAELNQPATSFPLKADPVAFFPLAQWFLHRRPGSYCAKLGRIRFGSGWLCQVWAKRIRSGSKPVCEKHPARFWPLLPGPIRTGCESDPA